MAQQHNNEYIEKPMTTYGPTQGPSRRYRRLRHPTFTATIWTDKNPLLQRGELGFEVDTHKVKIGDGVTYWNDLSYVSSVGQPISSADYQMGNALGGWTTMSQSQQDALNSGATTTNIAQIATNKSTIDNHIANTSNPHSVTATQVGLGNCDNTSDLDKPVSTATQTAIDGKVSKTGDDMTGTFWLKGYFDLRNQNQTNALCWCAGANNNRYKWALNNNINVVGFQYDSSLRSFMPLTDQAENLGDSSFKWNKVYALVLNNGGDLAIPANTTGTLATKAEVDDAANSGEQLYSTGVWYAKMYSATTVPTGAEYEGRNYADFSQVDGNNDPIIVVYTYTSGAWTTTATITPPKNHNGYMTITSKIWDIPEQSGQQGGKVLWSHNQGTFTPYPLIISFENISVTGDSSVTMPVSPTSTQIVNKNYVDTAVSGLSLYEPDLFDFKWRDATTSNTRWALANDFDWQTNAKGFNHLVSDYTNISPDTAVYVQLGGNIYFRDSAKDSLTGTYTKAYTDFDSLVTIYADTATASTSTTMYDDPDGTTSLGNPNASGTSTSVRIPLLDTIAGTEIRYYLSADGHKICKANQESNITTVYTATGVAWYYILDAENSRFKLPRVNPDMLKVATEVPVVGTTPSSIGSGFSVDSNLVGKNLSFSYAFSGGQAYGHMCDADDGSVSQGQPTVIGLTADSSHATTYYIGKQYLYFYVGD